MSYKVESSDHIKLVQKTFEQWSKSSPNMFFISSDGHKIFTQSIIISFFSPMIKESIESMNQDIGITVDAPSSHISSMLKILTKGIAVAKDKEELEQISELFQSLGIEFNNWQIGSRKKDQFSAISRIKSAAKVEVSVEVSNSNNNFDNKKLLKLPPEYEGKSSESKHQHQCDDCGRYFSRKTSLTRHELIHSGIKFGCNACSFTNARKEKLSKHIKESHADLDFDELYENKAIICDDEDASGIVKQEISNDETLNHSYETQNELSENTETTSNHYECNDCGKSFLKKSMLARHKLNHSGIKFACKACSSSFSRKDKLYRHIRNLHADVAVDFNDSFKNLYTISKGCDASDPKQEKIFKNEIDHSVSIKTIEMKIENGIETSSAGTISPL